jgi:Ca2+-binding EF-hand superfamily protein
VEAAGDGQRGLRLLAAGRNIAADRDGDFALSSEEQLSALGHANSALFECWDNDGDGLCSYSEFIDSGQQVFDELDADGDGNLTAEELQ